LDEMLDIDFDPNIALQAIAAAVKAAFKQTTPTRAATVARARSLRIASLTDFKTFGAKPIAIAGRPFHRKATPAV
jgi:hypothetical protein